MTGRVSERSVCELMAVEVAVVMKPAFSTYNVSVLRYAHFRCTVSTQIIAPPPSNRFLDSLLADSPKSYFVVKVFPQGEGRDDVRGFFVGGRRGNRSIRLDGPPARHLADIHHLRSCAQGIHDHKSHSLFRIQYVGSGAAKLQEGRSNCNHFPPVM